MSRKYDIGLLTVDDADIYKSLRLSALQTEPEAFGGSYEEESTYSDEEFRKILGTKSIFGAFHEAQLVGMLGFKAETSRKVRHNEELTVLYTTPAYRFMGIGSSLLNHVIEFAKDRVSQLCLYCNSNNHSLVRFYEKHSFTTIGIYPRGMKVDGKFYDNHIMFLKLVP